MDETPTTLTGLRSTIAKRAADVKAAVTNFTQNLATHLSGAETAAAEAKKSAELAASELSAVTKNSAAISKLKSDATISYAEFSTSVSEAMNPKNGIKPLVKTIQDSRDKAEELTSEISGIRDDSVKMRGDIESSRDDSQSMHETMTTVLSQSQDIREKIEKTYKIATDTGLAGSLSQRKGEITKQVYAWAFLAVVSFIATIIIISLLLPDLTKQNQSTTIITSKLFYISPTAIFTLFAITQYRNERRLLEEYAFKAAMANSLESYTELLGREFPKYRKEVLDFVLPVMTDIYDRNPLVAPKMTFSWSIGSKLAKLESTIKEEANHITEKTTQVKDDLSDQIDEITEGLSKAPEKAAKKSV